MPNSRGKARRLWCGWSEWLRMAETGWEWLRSIKNLDPVCDWATGASSKLITTYLTDLNDQVHRWKNVETCWNSKHVYFIYKYTINLQTTTVHVYPMSGNDHVRVSQARLRLCHNFGFERKFAQYFTHDQQTNRPTVCSFPERALGYGRKQQFIWCQHLCIQVFKVATSTQPNLAPIHPENIEHLETSDPSWGVHEWSHVCGMLQDADVSGQGTTLLWTLMSSSPKRSWSSWAACGVSQGHTAIRMGHNGSLGSVHCMLAKCIGTMNK